MTVTTAVGNESVHTGRRQHQRICPFALASSVDRPLQRAAKNEINPIWGFSLPVIFWLINVFFHFFLKLIVFLFDVFFFFLIKENFFLINVFFTCPPSSS